MQSSHLLYNCIILVALLISKLKQRNRDIVFLFLFLLNCSHNSNKVRNGYGPGHSVLLLEMPHLEPQLHCLCTLTYPCPHAVRMNGSAPATNAVRIPVFTSLVCVKVRDDNKRQHPCLVEFPRLPEQERSYNLQMSLETLK